MSLSPPFGKADLTNCERELIHLAGSIQPHGVLLTLDAPSLRIVQVSSSVESMLGRRPEEVLNQTPGAFGGDLEEQIRSVVSSSSLDVPAAMCCRASVDDRSRSFEGLVHRVEDRWVVVELEPFGADDGAPTARLGLAGLVLREQLELAVREVGRASSFEMLADAVVQSFKRLTGYDRVMVYRFDPDGHGKVIAEARDPRFEPLLGHRYPASDIPERARQLYVRNRLRLLADVSYEPSAVVPRELAGSRSGELDMSMCYLRSMSPLHLQYLENMGVTATLVVSLVRNEQLWGLIACHHYSPRNLRLGLRAGCEMLGEVATTRITAIENYAYARVAIQVQRLERRLVDATSTDGDWRVALFRNPWTLLDPVDATGAALFYRGDVLTAGEAPSTPQLRALLTWIEGLDSATDDVFQTSSVERANPALALLTPTASGVLAVRLSKSSPDYLMWFRKEQVHKVTWAGDPSKPMIGDDPLTLSPRRSFAAWSERVKCTALPWTSSEIALARAFGASLADIISRVNAVRFIVAHHQLERARDDVARAKQAMLLVGVDGTVLVSNEAYNTLVGSGALEPGGLPSEVQRALNEASRQPSGWAGRLELPHHDGQQLRPVSVRVEAVPHRDGRLLGYFVLFDDLTDLERSDVARRHLEDSLEIGYAPAPTDRVMSAVYANASLAAMDIADGRLNPPAAADILTEVEASTKRAADLYRLLNVLEPESEPNS